MAETSSAPAGTDKPRALAGLSLGEREALCRRCAKCCYRKIIVGQTVFITPFPCEYLDLSTHTCSVYARRLEATRQCLTVEEGFKWGAFPEDCPYVVRFAPPGYRPAQDHWSWDGEWHDFDDLADDLGVSMRVRELVRARGPWAPPLWSDFLAERPTVAIPRSQLKLQ